MKTIVHVPIKKTKVLLHANLIIIIIIIIIV